MVFIDEKRLNQVFSTYSELQNIICQKLAKADGKETFKSDRWEKDIGFGVTNVLVNGERIEKAAVNLSKVGGKVSEAMKKAVLTEADEFRATGISSIIHPVNPYVPIIHMNVRYFVMNDGIEWFGGGIDLTPHYIDKKEAIKFHQQLKKVCDKYDQDYYSEFRDWADRYFFLAHRNENRGVGGIFFDKISPVSDEHYKSILNFTKDLANLYPELYSGILKEKSERPFSEREKVWQNYRRGRYVEFNLIYDRGTRFGLESGGNIESILLSMPPDAKWIYNFEPEAGSQEEFTIKLLKKKTKWICS